MSDSFATPQTVTHHASLSIWDFPGKNTEVGCHFLLQGIFLTRNWTHVTPGDSCTAEQPGKCIIIWYSPYKLMKFPLASKNLLESLSQRRRLDKRANQTLVHKLLLQAVLWPFTHLFLLSSKPYLPLLSIPQWVPTFKKAFHELLTLQQSLFSPCPSATTRSWHSRTGHTHIHFWSWVWGFRFSIFSGFKSIRAGTMPQVLWHLKT